MADEPLPGALRETRKEVPEAIPAAKTPAASSPVGLSAGSMPGSSAAPVQMWISSFPGS